MGPLSKTVKVVVALGSVIVTNWCCGEKYTAAQSTFIPIKFVMPPESAQQNDCTKVFIKWEVHSPCPYWPRLDKNPVSFVDTSVCTNIESLCKCNVLNVKCRVKCDHQPDYLPALFRDLNIFMISAQEEFTNGFILFDSSPENLRSLKNWKGSHWTSPPGMSPTIKCFLAKIT